MSVETMDVKFPCTCSGGFLVYIGDVLALVTFHDIYRYQQIDIPEGYFEKKESTAFCKLRHYVLPDRPVCLDEDPIVTSTDWQL